MKSWTKLCALSWRDRGLLLKTFFWLSLMRACILLVPFKRIVVWRHLTSGETSTELNPSLLEQTDRIGWAIRAISARVPWDNTCLTQALAGNILLRQQKIPSTLYLGVTKNSAKPQKMEAHAWLRCGSAILTGEAGHDRFTVVGKFISEKLED